MTPRKQQILDIFGKEPETLDELAQCVIKVIEQYRQISQVRRSQNIATPVNLKVLGFSWDVKFTEEISCSHSAPNGFPTNWNGQKVDSTGEQCPRHYPGYYGRVWIRYQNEPVHFGSDPFKGTLTHTGTGGGGGLCGPWERIRSAQYNKYGHNTKDKNAYPEINCYGWDYRFFVEDWPLLKLITANQIEEYKKEKFFALLGDKYHSPFYFPNHTFLWEDPETKAADTNFLANII